MTDSTSIPHNELRVVLDRLILMPIIVLYQTMSPFCDSALLVTHLVSIANALVRAFREPVRLLLTFQNDIHNMLVRDPLLSCLLAM